MKQQIEWEVSKSATPKKECPLCKTICKSISQGNEDDNAWCKTQFEDLKSKNLTDKQLAALFDQRWGPGWEERILTGAKKK
jgi:hypothetical protein